MSSPLFAQVAVPGPFEHGLTYLCPSVFKAHALIGARVLVPLGKRNVIGVVLSTTTQSDLNIDKVKPIEKVIDLTPIFSTALCALFRWISDYYHVSIGDVFDTALPKFLSRGDAFASKKPLKALQQKSAKTETALTLNEAQQLAVDYVHLHHDKFKTILLEGVTGSGKTEVYLQATAHFLKQNKQILILVPEIGLTPQTIARFEARFNQTIVAYHSGLSNQKRLDAWYYTQTGEAKIIIGTRSALLMPFADLGLIVMDESHDQSFKQQSGIRYHARDVAIKRASLLNIPIVLGSATPSLESLHNAELKRFSHFVLPARAGGAQHVEKHLIDMRKQAIQAGIAKAMLDAMSPHLEAGNQVMLFLNRRGFAPVLLCHECGWVAKHSACDRHFTLHQKRNALRCHHCDVTTRMPQTCPHCDSDKLIPVGTGTERLEEFLTQQFPNKTVLRIDRDTTQRKSAFEEKLDDIHSGKADIIIGTQMIAKGHHFANITMVGIIDIDAALFSQDFRAIERMGQLIVQVAGRAGREAKKGEVYLQTHQPQHPNLQSLLKEGYSAFAKRLLKERQLAHWPPQTHLAAFFVESKTENYSIEMLQQLQQNLQAWHIDQVEALGPIPAMLAKKSGWQRDVLLLQSTSRKQLHIAIDAAKHWLLQQKPTRQWRWYLDVDPQGF